MSRSLPFWAGMDWSLSEVVQWGEAVPPLPVLRGEGLARERKASGAQRSGGERASQDRAHPETPPHPPPDHSPGVGLSPHAGRDDQRASVSAVRRTVARARPVLSSRAVSIAA